MKPHSPADAVLSLLIVACIAGALALVVTVAYKAGCHDTEVRLKRKTGPITAEEIENRRR